MADDKKKQLGFGDLFDDQADDRRKPASEREVLPGLKPPSNTKSETSLAAADSMTKPAARLRHLALKFVAEQGSVGATCDEAVRSLGMIHQTCPARFNELRGKHMIAPSGRKRPTSSGRDADVMVVTQIGLDELRRAESA